jgi:O-antigen/teichoic acid export membrane protein
VTERAGGSPASLATRSARGVGWAFAATFAGRVVVFAALAVLARILAPEDFGLVAFALVFILYADTIGDLGTGVALIHWPDRRADAAQLTFLVNLATGFLWLGLAWLLAGKVAAFFGSPEGEAVLKTLAWSFPIRALGNTHDALVQKDLRFRARLVPEVGMAAGKGGVSLWLALAGWGVWSLVWGQLAGLALWTLLLWVVVPWRPGWFFPADLVRPMVRYGRSIVAVNVLAAVTHHADLVVVGRLLGAAALGFYQVAYKVPEVAVTLLVRMASKVLFPAFSLVHHSGGGVREAYLAALRYTALLTLPASAGLFLLAGPIVRVAFGPGWEPSVPILQALAVYVALRALGTHVGDVLKATGRPGVLAALGVAKAVLLVPALVVAGRWGAVAVGAALAGVTAVNLLLNFAAVFVLEGVRVGQLVDALHPALGGTAVMTAALVLWVRTPAAAEPLAALAGGISLGVGVYLAFLALSHPELLRTALRSLRGVPAEGGAGLAVQEERP